MLKRLCIAYYQIDLRFRLLQRQLDFPENTVRIVVVGALRNIVAMIC